MGCWVHGSVERIASCAIIRNQLCVIRVIKEDVLDIAVDVGGKCKLSVSKIGPENIPTI